MNDIVLNHSSTPTAVYQGQLLMNTPLKRLSMILLMVVLGVWAAVKLNSGS